MRLSFTSRQLRQELYQDVQAKLLPLLQVLTDGLGQALEVLLQVDGIVAKSRKKCPIKNFEGIQRWLRQIRRSTN